MEIIDIRDYKEIHDIDLEIKNLKRLRKSRSDVGKKRAKYDPSLSPKYRSYLGRANKRGLPMTISQLEFDIILSSSCIYCGGSSRMTIDRRDSLDGYTQDNSYPCCVTCNVMKWTMSHEQFLGKIKLIYRHLSL